MSIEGPSASHNSPAMAPKAETPKQETVKINGMTVAKGLEGAISSPHPKPFPEKNPLFMNAATQTKMVSDVKNRDVEGLRSISSREIAGDARLNTLAKEESDKDRASDIRANKEELQDHAESARIAQEKNQSSKTL